MRIERAAVASFMGLVLAFFAGGCGSSAPSTPDVLPTYSPAELKQQLDEVAETGAGGSSLMAIGAGLNALREDDPAKADELLKDFGKLERSPDAQERKKLARRMADKL